MIPIFDACASVVKSDNLVDSELHDALEAAFKKLQTDQADSPDWHPNSNDMVQDLVHPSLYPLVYGRSRVLGDELVGVENAVHTWAGKGRAIPKIDPERDVKWSDTYQWLPSNVAFQEDGSVKFTSYINNLHPTRYPGIYSTIEKLIATALPAWDQCLLESKDGQITGPGRKESRFETPSQRCDLDERNWDPPKPERLVEIEVEIDKANAEPYNEDSDDDSYIEDLEDEQAELEDTWRSTRLPVFREPKTYQEVNYKPSPTKHCLFEKFKKTGLQIIVKMVSIELTPEKPEFPAGSWHVEGQLNERICATALYYLDSENITDSSLSFRMQTSDDQDELQRNVDQFSYRWLYVLVDYPEATFYLLKKMANREYNYATNFENPGACVQNYGTVDIRPGRLLAFPNVFQHRVSSFKLADPTKPGHRRFIALWLVDPHIRIISTANVPPQQQQWWVDAAFGQSTDSHKSAVDKLPVELVTLLQEKGLSLQGTGKDSAKRLPAELVDLIRDEMADSSLMSLEEAKEHRLALMAQRSAMHERVMQETLWCAYNFCEH